ncbi:MAG: trypsin-like peptidase domain-containing protein, partial [Clostridia bacterium]|nr:trypsin-like peptidase domain-containing protein [Clostridia bacterium]
MDTKTDENAKAQHSWDNGKEKEKATCIKNGIVQYTCIVCDDYYTKEIKATGGHDYIEQIAEEASCIKDGEKKFTCSQCGDFYMQKFSLAKYTANEIYNFSKDTVGEIITYTKNGDELALGTGFAYSQDGKIITNYHVIEDAYSAKITISGKTYLVDQVLAYDKNIDLAVLKIKVEGLTVLGVCNKDHSVGKSVYAFGSSRGLTATFSQGIITYADREMDGVHYVQHDAAISSGNSGGPLINEYGEIIGVNTMTIRDSQNLNFAISVKEFSNLVYETPLTMIQFYEKESDVFLKMKNYIIQYGTYDYEDNKYELDFEIIQDYSTGLATMTSATYLCNDQEIELSIFLTDGDISCLLIITIDVIDGVYSWSYIDGWGIYMQGTIYASSWTSNSLLNVSYYNTSYS